MAPRDSREFHIQTDQRFEIIVERILIPRKLLSTGDRAPDFSLISNSGKPVSLVDFLGKKMIVLFFYPRDGTPGCKAEVLSFREKYDVFTDLDAEVIGISSDTIDSHSKFASECDLSFPLLSDNGGTVRKEYGVGKTLWIVEGRVTYVIDKKGKIRHVFSSQLRPKNHAVEAIKSLIEIVGASR
jgi:peroxiredoxin Q/BCP